MSYQIEIVFVDGAEFVFNSADPIMGTVLRFVTEHASKRFDDVEIVTVSRTGGQ